MQYIQRNLLRMQCSFPCLYVLIVLHVRSVTVDHCSCCPVTENVAPATTIMQDLSVSARSFHSETDRETLTWRVVAVTLCSLLLLTPYEFRRQTYPKLSCSRPYAKAGYAGCLVYQKVPRVWRSRHCHRYSRYRYESRDRVRSQRNPETDRPYLKGVDPGAAGMQVRLFLSISDNTGRSPIIVSFLGYHWRQAENHWYRGLYRRR